MPPRGEKPPRETRFGHLGKQDLAEDFTEHPLAPK